MPSPQLIPSPPREKSALHRKGWKAYVISIALMGSFSPAQAFDDPVLARKLSTIPVLIPADAEGKPMLINRQINGKTTPVLFGAMSPEAAEALAQQVTHANGKQKHPTPQFRLTNLVALEELVDTLRKQNPAVIRAYIPDPIQESAVVPMLIQQGAKPDEALQTARNQPIVFCPDPLIQVNYKTAKNSQITAPCGLDFKEMALFVLGPKFEDKRPSLTALPLDRMIGLLNQLNESIRNNVIIVASPSMLAFLSRINEPATSAGNENKSPDRFTPQPDLDLR